MTVTTIERPGALPNPECDRSSAPAGKPAGENVQNLGAVNVFGTLEDSLNVGSKTGLWLRETPESVTVMTRERLDAQNLTTLADSVRTALSHWIELRRVLPEKGCGDVIEEQR